MKLNLNKKHLKIGLFAYSLLVIGAAIITTQGVVKSSVTFAADNNCCGESDYGSCDNSDPFVTQYNWQQGYYACQNGGCAKCRQGGGAVCGNGTCQPGENHNNCPVDCAEDGGSNGGGNNGGNNGGGNNGGSNGNTGVGDIAEACAPGTPGFNPAGCRQGLWCYSLCNKCGPGDPLGSDPTDHPTADGAMIACGGADTSRPIAACGGKPLNSYLCDGCPTGSGKRCTENGWATSCQINVDACGNVNGGIYASKGFLGCGNVVPEGNGNRCLNCYDRAAAGIPPFTGVVCYAELSSCGANSACFGGNPPPQQNPPPQNPPPQNPPPQNQTANVVIDKAVVGSSGPYMIGDIVTFRVRITNTGQTTYTSLRFSDQWDATFLNYIGGSAVRSTGQSIADINPVLTTRLSNFIEIANVGATALGNLAPGQYYEFTLRYSVVAPTNPNTCNTAFAQPNGLPTVSDRDCVTSRNIDTDL